MSAPNKNAPQIPLNTKEGKLTIVALVIMFYTIALFFSVTLHEILGHGLASALVGGDFYAVYVSPGSGYASIYFPESVSMSARAFVYMAGISVEIIGGLIVLFLIFPRLSGFLSGLFALVLSVVMLVHPSIYLFLGYFYEGGDSFKAAYVLNVLGTPTGEFFIVTGLILLGIFMMLVSMAALEFLGRYIDATGEDQGMKVLGLFWLPLIILGTVSIVAAVFLTSGGNYLYALANACVLLLFIGATVFLVPHIVEPPPLGRYRLGLREVMGVLLCFIVIMAVWVSAFGPTDSSAHGILFSQPPIETEVFYSDYSIGNVDVMVYENGTAMVSISLRNLLDNTSSPLDSKIYHTFDQRPNWYYYIERSRFMLMSMFDLSREEGANVSFTTGFDIVRAAGVDYTYGRRCTTYLPFEFRETDLVGGVRQQPGTGHTAGGTDEPTEALFIEFDDPWAMQGGFLDEVRISWAGNLTLTYYSASNSGNTHILFNRGSLSDNSIGWKNINFEDSPSTYLFILRRVQET